MPIQRVTTRLKETAAQGQPFEDPVLTRVPNKNFQSLFGFPFPSKGAEILAKGMSVFTEDDTLVKHARAYIPMLAKPDTFNPYAPYAVVYFYEKMRKSLLEDISIEMYKGQACIQIIKNLTT